jgi:hypothetical protein
MLHWRGERQPCSSDLLSPGGTRTPAAILSIAFVVAAIALSWFLIDSDKAQAEIHVRDVVPQCKSMPVRE